MLERPFLRRQQACNHLSEETGSLVTGQHTFDGDCRNFSPVWPFSPSTLPVGRFPSGAQRTKVVHALREVLSRYQGKTRLVYENEYKVTLDVTGCGVTRLVVVLTFGKDHKTGETCLYFNCKTADTRACEVYAHLRQELLNAVNPQPGLRECSVSVLANHVRRGGLPPESIGMLEQRVDAFDAARRQCVDSLTFLGLPSRVLETCVRMSVPHYGTDGQVESLRQYFAEANARTAECAQMAGEDKP